MDLPGGALTVKDYVALTALVVSVCSLFIAWHQFRRDRPKLTLRATFYQDFHGVRSHILVVAVNSGRRPVKLRLLGGTDWDGHWAATYLNKSEGGLTLAEHERHEWMLYWEDLRNSTWLNPDMYYERLCIDDSLGLRHGIPGSKKAIKELRAFLKQHRMLPELTHLTGNSSFVRYFLGPGYLGHPDSGSELLRRGRHLLYKNELDRAEKWINRAIAVFEATDAQRALAVARGRIAEIREKRGQFEEALEIRRKGQLPIFEGIGDKYSLAVTMIEIADILARLNRMDEAHQVRARVPRFD